MTKHGMAPKWAALVCGLMVMVSSERGDAATASSTFVAQTGTEAATSPVRLRRTADSVNIQPEVDAKAGTSAASLTFTAGARSVVAGRNIVFTWASANAESCEASGTWTGAKALSGTETVKTPLVAATYPYTLTCYDVAGVGVSETVSLRVTANTPPTISGTPPTSVQVGQLYSFTPTASDRESAAVGFSIQNRPVWATFSTTTGTLSGTPSSAQVGTYSNIVISASDGVYSTELPAFNIEVISDVPQVSLTAGAGSVVAGRNLVLTWSSTNSTTCLASGAWSGSKALSGSETVKTALEAGTYDYTLTCSNSLGLSGTRTVSINVTPNTPPTISGAPATSVIAGQLYSFTPTASDAESTSVGFTIQNRPVWATFSSSTGALSGTPTAAQVGVYSNIVISASDGVYSTALPAFNIEVLPPLNSPSVTLTAGATSVVAGRNLVLTWSSANVTKCQASGSWTGNKALSGTETVRTSTTPGAYNYTLTCSAGKTTAVKTVTVNVTPNTPPTISGTPSPTAVVGQLYSFTPTASDAESSSLGFRITGRPAWAAFNTSTGTLSGTPTASNIGLHSNIIISASDGVNSTALPAFSINVINTAPAPTVTLGATPTSVASGQPVTLSWSSTEATSCSASGGWTGSRALSGSETVNPTATSTYTLTCSGLGGSANQSVTVTVVPPPSVALSATPLSLAAGQNSTLTWSSTNASSCTASGGWTGTRGVAGTEVVSPSATTSYTLTCTGTGGTSAQTVTVAVVPAPTLTLSANPTSLATGQSSTLSWSTTNASSCTASGGWSGSKSVSGNQAVTVSATTTYSLACTGTGGTVSRSVTVTVVAAPTLVMAINPTSVPRGSSANLTWSSTDATTCTASGGWSGNRSLSGNIQVSPSTTTTYTLECAGVGGTRSSSVTLTVEIPAPTISFSVNPATIGSGGTATLSWTTTDATACAASGGWSGTRGTSGSENVTPTVTATYTLTCTGPGGSQSSQVEVVVTPDAPSLTFTSTRTSLIVGESATLNWSALGSGTLTCSAGGAWSGTKPAVGSQAITPASAGTLNYSLACSNVGGTTTRVVTITVTVNQPPAISGSPSTEAVVGQSYSFSPSASDPEGRPLTFSIQNRPLWASFDNNTGRLSGIPSSAHLGTYSGIIIAVNDGVNSSALPSFGITVRNVTVGTAELTWVAPTLNTDGSPLTNLAGFKVYYWKDGVGETVLDLPDPLLTSMVIEQLSAGTWYFQMTAYNTNNVESARTGSVFKTIL
jgi:hypothetical protein